MNEILQLNDGTELEGHMIESDKRLFLYIQNKTLAEAFALLNDPEKTKIIKGIRYGSEQTIRGYKALWSISRETGGMVSISASLRKN